MKMKKVNILVFFLLVCSMSLSAQKFPLKLGLRVAPSLDWMNPSTKDYSFDGIKPGISIGLIGDIYFAERYAFSTGFDFAFLNGKLSYRDSILLPADSKLHNGTINRKYNFIYLQIPITIKMKTKVFGMFAFYGQIGFGTGFRLKATATDIFQPDGGGAVTQLDYNLDQETSFIRESFIIGLGTELHIDQSSRIILGLNYSNSLNSVLTGVNFKSGQEIKSMLNYIEVNMGFLF